MKAISIKNPFATQIMRGTKNIEYRTWDTKHRGDLLICSSANPQVPGMMSGCALCVVELVDTQYDSANDVYEWHLSNVRKIKAFPVKGKLNFFEVDDALIHFADEEHRNSQTSVPKAANTPAAAPVFPQMPGMPKTIADMDRISWRAELVKDQEILELLTLMVADITPAHDSKLQELLTVLREKVTHPINPGNRKVIIFTAFADTAMYLYEHVSNVMQDEFGLHTAVVTGSVDGRTTARLKKADMNTILTCFSPISKDKALLNMGNLPDIDILIATDCISEGQNLQDCDYLINYDIHWNPVRIIQRFGRIDRIGSKNSVIQLVNFWPDITLDEYINLKSRVETRMKIVDMTATGDDNILSDEEKHDLEYRKAQLQRLQEEVVDIEEMSSGISIMDLGLNEFRMDLLEYIKQHPEVEHTPMGLHAVAPASSDCPPGVIFVLKNRTQSVNVDNRNRLHPFYMVYISEDGEVICDYLQPKKLLDTMRLVCKGKDKPIEVLYHRFNEETNDGRSMGDISELLSEAINSIIDVKEESDIDSLFSPGGTSALMSAVSGLEDFELICFLVVK